MINCFDDDKLITRKRHRPLQASEMEQSVSSEKKKEIFVIKYDSNDSIQPKQRKKINMLTSKLFALEKNQIELKKSKEKGKENMRRKNKSEVNILRIIFRPNQQKKKQFLRKFRPNGCKRINSRMKKFWITINF